MLQNEHLLTTIGLDTAENEPSEISNQGCPKWQCHSQGAYRLEFCFAAWVACSPRWSSLTDRFDELEAKAKAMEEKFERDVHNLNPITPSSDHSEQF